MLQRNIRISANGIDFDLNLKANMVLVDGASGIGKSMLFRALRDYSLINGNKYLCINKDTLTDSNIIKSMILGADNKLIIIDNAEIVLDNIDYFASGKFDSLKNPNAIDVTPEEGDNDGSTKS